MKTREGLEFEVIRSPSTERDQDSLLVDSQIADSSTDQVLVRESIQLMKASIKAVQMVLPVADSELVSGFFADLLDLWETGQRLDKELRKLAKSGVPCDSKELRKLLIWISAIQVDMASYWINQVRKDIPKLLRELDK